MKKLRFEAKGKETGREITRREFFGFFLLGGFLSLLSKKVNAVIKQGQQKAMFWRKIK